MLGRKSAWGEAAEDELPQWYCSSDDFKRMLRSEHPELLVPEHDIVYLGTHAAWDPSKEAPHAEGATCPDRERIGPGSRLCCPQCHHSGFERKLAAQRRLATDPPPQSRAATAASDGSDSRAAAPAAKKRPGRPTKLQRWWRNAAWAKQATRRNPSAPRPSRSGRKSA